MHLNLKRGLRLFDRFLISAIGQGLTAFVILIVPFQLRIVTKFHQAFGPVHLDSEEAFMVMFPWLPRGSAEDDSGTTESD